MRGSGRSGGSGNPVGPQGLRGDFHPVMRLKLFELLSSFHEAIAGTDAGVLDALRSRSIAVGEFAD